MGKRTEGVLTPEDVKDWPDAIIGEPLAGPGRALARPPEGKAKKRPDTFDEKVKAERKKSS